jgi:hypothetical protein
MSETTLKKLYDFASWLNTGVYEDTIATKHILQYGHCAMSGFASQFSARRDIGSKSLRASQLGKPAVLQAMDKLGIKREGDSIQNKLKLIFHQGEIFECLAIELLKVYGFKVTLEQAEVEFDGVKGHIDCVVDDAYLLELKTMSGQYTSKFRKAPDDTRGYVSQLAIYQDALSLPGAWLAYDKANSEAFIKAYPNDPKIIAESLDRASYIIGSMDYIEKFEDIFEYFEAPPPVDYSCKVKNIHGQTVPEEMRYDWRRWVFYNIEVVENSCYNKSVELVTGLKTKEEAVTALQVALLK